MTEQENCIFCKIVRKEIKTEIIDETENFIAFPDANPKVEGHTLIIPKKHFESLKEMPSELGNELIETIKKTAEKKYEQGSEGFNLALNNGSVAGQIIKHLHFHLLPRKQNDSFSWRL